MAALEPPCPFARSGRRPLIGPYFTLSYEANLRQEGQTHGKQNSSAPSLLPPGLTEFGTANAPSPAQPSCLVRGNELTLPSPLGRRSPVVCGQGLHRWQRGNKTPRILISNP